jgi:soluble lytic murein transglycosylase-like protein
MGRIAIIALMLIAGAPARAEPAPSAPPSAPPPAAAASADSGTVVPADNTANAPGDGGASPPPSGATAPADTGATAPAEAAPAAGNDNPPPAAAARTDADLRESVCLMIESAARAQRLPLEFFARVIWQESRFQPGVVGPRTRSGDRAQGIAQFMPRTAAERGLLDPFDPVQALPKSAEFLRELADRFGNLGLAAAAYNAGPQRVRDWLSGARTLPAETRHYVYAITGLSADEWARGGRREPTQPPPNCRQLMALLHRAPNPFVAKLEERVTLVAASPWGVQLAASFSREHALSNYAMLAKRYADILAGRDPSLLSTVLRSRGTQPLYQVRVGAETRAAADSLCGSIRRAGGACMVLRNTAS